MRQGNVDVFPIFSSAFGLRPDWFYAFTPKMIAPAYLLLTLLLIVWIGILALQRFENPDFEKKLWNLPVIIIAILFWSALVLGLKELVDSFNTFLVGNVFGISWVGFGFPEIGSFDNVFAWPTEGLARFLPNLAYWVIYAFYIIFFFFYAVLGPLVLARGVLFDEVETLLELIKELTILLLWQTTMVIVVAFVMPDIVSGKPFPARPEANFYFLSLILGILIFFVPSLTRKFVSHLGRPFVPLGFRWGGAMLGVTGLARAGGVALAGAGVSTRAMGTAKTVFERAARVEDFRTRYQLGKRVQTLEGEERTLEKIVRDEQEEDREQQQTIFSIRSNDESLGLPRPDRKETFFDLSKQAQEEIRRERKHEE